MNPGEGLGRNVCRGGWEAEREGTKADREELSQGVPEIRAGTIGHVNDQVFSGVLLSHREGSTAGS